MANYAPSTRARISDLITGMRVDTNVLAGATYLLTGPTATEDVFNVFGRIKIMQLFMEVITDLGNQACVMFYTYTSATPTITVQPISAVGASMALLLRGGRYFCTGTTVATACVVDAEEGISPVVMKEKMIIGLKGGVGTIGINTATVSILTGTVRFSLFYVPMSDGAYATNVL
jgi:hypothetical protein